MNAQIQESNEAPKAVTSVDADGVDVISITNPTAEQMTQFTEALSSNTTVVKATKFSFKKNKDKDTGKVSFREAVELPLPMPSAEGLADIISAGGKQLELLMDAVEDVISDAAREVLYESYDYSAWNFPYDKITWEAIANKPKAQRRGGGIPKETWEAFEADYISCMPEIADKPMEKVQTAAKLLVNKLQAVKTNKTIVEFLVGQLALYMEHGPNSAQFVDCTELLLNKAELFLNQTEADLLANL